MIFNANGDYIRTLSVPASSDGPDQSVKIFLRNPVQQALPLPEVRLPVFQVISDVLRLCKPGSNGWKNCDIVKKDQQKHTSGVFNHSPLPKGVAFNSLDLA